jgi:hypothetical protein
MPVGKWKIAAETGQNRELHGDDPYLVFPSFPFHNINDLCEGKVTNEIVKNL